MRDPLRDLEEMRKRMNKIFGGFEELKGSEFQRPNVDVIDKPEEITVIAELPGVNKEDIKINAEPTSLEIRAEASEEGEKSDEGYYYRERSTKSYQRYVDLPSEIKPNKAEANYKNGILEISLPKKYKEKEEGSSVPIN